MTQGGNTEYLSSPVCTSHDLNELEGKSTEERKQMMQEQHKIDWNLILSFYREGVCVRKYECVETFTRPDGTQIEVPRKRWRVAMCIPSFQEHPEYVNELVNI